MFAHNDSSKDGNAMKFKALVAIGLLLAIALLPTIDAAPQVRVKDLTRIEGVRTNALIGYGLVVGLQGTGDGTQAQFTIQSLANLLRRSGVAIPQGAIRVKNVAAVMVTAELPPFARPSQRLDVKVSSIGDAKSLLGGTLLMTPLQGPDGNTYALAQGAVSLGGGFSGGGGGNSVVKNHPTAGTVASGASIERMVQMDLSDFDSFRLLLNEADFATANRISAAINADFGFDLARAEDSASVKLNFPPDFSRDPVGLLARVEGISVRPDNIARVVVNERTGTVVMGQDVRISTVALAHGSLTVEISTDLEASQPNPLSEGETVVLPQREVYVTEGPNQVLTLNEGVTVAELVQALNTLGVTARDMVAIFEAMKTAGALHAELVLM